MLSCFLWYFSNNRLFLGSNSVFFSQKENDESKVATNLQEAKQGNELPADADVAEVQKVVEGKKIRVKQDFSKICVRLLRYG